MAYPFAPMPTLDEFIQQASAKYGVQVKSAPISPAGRYLVRTLRGGKRVAFIPPRLQGTDRLVPTQLRSFCEQLKIPPADFGLILD